MKGMAGASFGRCRTGGLRSGGSAWTRLPDQPPVQDPEGEQVGAGDSRRGGLGDQLHAELSRGAVSSARRAAEEEEGIRSRGSQHVGDYVPS